MSSSPPNDVDRNWLRTLTLLYVEDDTETREVVAEYLERRAARVIVAESGEEGLAQFQAERPAIVLTDIRMDRMDGLAMVEEIRRMDSDVPVIVTTAFGQVEYLERAIDANVDKLVKKPIDADALDAALCACARRLRAEASLERERMREVENARAAQREALSLLAGGLAHDFNNLLQVIVLSVDEAIESSAPGDNVHDVLAGAMSSLRRASDLGNKLLTLSAGWIMETRPGPIGPTLRDALARGTSAGPLDLDIHVPADLPDVIQDSRLLEQAFFKIVVNAREAMRGSGTLHITATERTLIEGEIPSLPAARYVQISFRDDGPGIAPEHLPRLFDPYFTTKKWSSTRGTGLGLALCLAIVRKHGGLVTAHNADPGAVFTVFLKAEEAPSTAAPS